jgi:hypothetical protein
VRIVRLNEGDSVAALAVLTYEDLNRGVDVGGDTPLDVALHGGNGANGSDPGDVDDADGADSAADDNGLADALAGDEVDELAAAQD